jgi:hypothetical protein
LPGGFSRAVDIEYGPSVSLPIHQPTGLLIGREWASEQIIKKERAQRFDRNFGERRQKARKC